MKSHIMLIAACYVASVCKQLFVTCLSVEDVRIVLT